MGADLEWMNDRACREDDVDPEAFFANNATIESQELAAFAKSICAGCPVKAECLAYAQENRLDHGIWGGFDEYERAQMARRGGVFPRRSKAPTFHTRCGTYSGVSRHRKLEEGLCDDCKQARSVYENELRRKKRAAIREEKTA